MARREVITEYVSADMFEEQTAMPKVMTGLPGKFSAMLEPYILRIRIAAFVALLFAALFSSGLLNILLIAGGSIVGYDILRWYLGKKYH